jgi:DNA-binding MarR family transcriptional regulator
MVPSRDHDDKTARDVWHCIRGLIASPDVVANEHQFMHEVGLGAGPVRALRALLAVGPQSMRTLAEYLGCDKSYVTGLVKPLQANELVTLEPCSSDGRVKIVNLTPHGTVIARQAQQVHETPPEVLGRLEASDLDQLRAILERLGAPSRGSHSCGT